ncbi:hypothetical protein STRIP9103_09175 [Streptomyces ipomoeae 91-03]|uniref:Uncharacterized protein n=1 Tax=Streptomyces ipomoeae 91-03 TaxID=698759 RepID=L1KKT0_9ACTN|nr:hypothetical protein STRIP9103_09175 [Streptomyces ipomoeae 91-03]
MPADPRDQLGRGNGGVREARRPGPKGLVTSTCGPAGSRMWAAGG